MLRTFSRGIPPKPERRMIFRRSTPTGSNTRQVSVRSSTVSADWTWTYEFHLIHPFWSDQVDGLSSWSCDGLQPNHAQCHEALFLLQQFLCTPRHFWWFSGPQSVSPPGPSIARRLSTHHGLVYGWPDIDSYRLDLSWRGGNHLGHTPTCSPVFERHFHGVPAQVSQQHLLLPFLLQQISFFH